MDFPIFNLKPEEVVTIYGILGRYPEAMGKQFKLRWGPIRPSFRVRALVEYLIGPSLLV